MNDIVERLRAEYDDAGGGPGSTMLEAADEIEKLRRAVSKMADAAGPAWTPRWVLDAPWYKDDDG